MNKSKVTSRFRGILYRLYLLAPFSFLLLLSIGKRSTLAKILAGGGGGGGGGGGCSPPDPPVSTACIDYSMLKYNLTNIYGKIIKIGLKSLCLQYEEL